MSRLYTIPINGLKNGYHTFEFDIDDEFFEHFEESEVKKGNLTVFIESEKNTSFMDMAITIKGYVEVLCDRCLEPFNQAISCENDLLLKFGDNEIDDDPDVMTISKDEGEFDLSQIFYEYIILALPIKRVHPDDAEGNSTCDPEMLEKLSEHLSNSEEQIDDPRWDALKKLKKQLKTK
ncbi:MAG: DUF177 domain-containing protein [Bacteroidales bacterium]|nr:DUF177 domain-containing protein [Bacteroidales bacterium]